MSETTQTTTEPATNGGGDEQEKNWRRMEEQLNAARQEIDQLRPFRDRELLRKAGFDPETGEGKSLMRDLGSAAIKPDEGEDLSAAIKRFAESEYGWKPKAPLSPTEQEQARAAEAQQQLSGATAPADLSPTGDLVAKIQEARDNSDFALAARYERQLKAQQGAG